MNKRNKNVSLPVSGRRQFIKRVSGAAAATMAASVTGLPSQSATNSFEADACEIGPVGPEQRRHCALLTTFTLSAILPMSNK